MSRYVEALFRYKLRFVALIVLLPTAAALASVLLFPWYQATTQLWVNSPSYFGIVPTATGWDQYLTPSQNESDSIGQLLSTDAFLGQIGDKLLAQGTFSSPAQRNSEMRDLQKFNVYSVGSHLLVLQVSCRRMRVCLDALSATVDLQREWLKQTEQAQAAVALDFYTAQAKAATDRLNASQAAVKDYLAQHPSVQPNIDTIPLPPEFAVLQQKVNDDQKTLKGFQDRLEGINLASAASDRIEQTILRVIDPPKPMGGSLIPSASRKTALMIGLAALVPGLVYLIALGWIDRTIRSVREIEAKIGARVVATIPSMRTVDLLQ